MNARITPVDTPLEVACEHCGCLGVTREAWAEWSVAEQAWVLSQAFDFAFCHRCHRPTRPVERPARGEGAKAKGPIATGGAG